MLKIFNKLISVFNISMIGFIHGHNYLKRSQLKKIRKALQFESNTYTKIFESRYAKKIGNGEAISFASARMGFYTLMQAIEIQPDDEIILCGLTCSVMPNAVLRLGAKPIYCDIDMDTLGSSAKSIKEKITSKTRIIVAQHSFGIPCNIEEICKICKKNNIFLIEDCAITFGSKYKNKNVGTFGDAALFSTDHTKPINTFTGGLVYSEDLKTIKKLRIAQEKLHDIPINKKKAIYKQFTLERLLAKPKAYGILNFINSVMGFIRKKLNTISPFLDEDDGLHFNNLSYSYPSKMPDFIALIGIYELENWNKVALQRKESMNYFKTKLKNSLLRSFIPNAYFDDNRDIVPLRFAFSHPKSKNIKDLLGELVDFDSVWFLKPIINTKVSLESFLYITGSCRNSEKSCPHMINLPLTDNKTIDIMLNKISKKV